MECTCGCRERRGWEAAIVCGRIMLKCYCSRVAAQRFLTADCIQSVILFCKDKQPLSSELPCTGSAFFTSRQLSTSSNGTFRAHCRHMSCRVAFFWSPDCGIPQEENKQSGWFPLAAQDKASKTSHSVVVIGLNDNRTRLIDSFYK